MKIGMGILTVILLVVLLMMVKNSKTPILGVIDGQFKALGNKPNGVSTQTDDTSKYVEALDYNNLEKAKEMIKEACDTYGTSKVVSESNNYMHVVFTTGKMKYKDDVEFYFDESTNKIHYRSESRIGYSDMGLNKERYDEIVQLYKKLKEAN